MTKEKQAPLGKSVKIGIPSQNLIVDPRGKTSIRGRSARIDEKNIGKVEFFEPEILIFPLKGIPP